ncbi:uncharacterized protein A4U43_C10F14410 [Asparagus officinalis]|uniref:Thioredoxin-like fold domain-containing protein n=1 Tax=Asparagus officinalis TaxID=4686 RepID=A0A5P1E5X5_ASPOF|nr:uncharacterized protein A4U43_C10F14410 [Asparagus officinalis]
MSLLQSFFVPKNLNPFPFITNPNPNPGLKYSLFHRNRNLKHDFSAPASSNSEKPPEPDPNPNPKKASARRRQNPKVPSENPSGDLFPSTIPRKPRRGRRSEAAAVEDFIRDSLEKTFASIREKNSEVLDGKGEILKERIKEEEEKEEGKEDDHVIEEEDPNWPLDADVGWGVRASEYFEKHSIKNVVVDGVEIDWEGEIDEGWVKEINCLEWESFAFHPSPLIVLVFERYNRAADNWKLLKELEKAAKIYWNAKDRLPPRVPYRLNGFAVAIMELP